ncbi:rhodanese-like protein [Gleimia coleocanis DSM 15436]|uniref:Rhodanese-like protein n=1 Tax=Gleimia coleocanis DSM 15436 TaxID=525245 RepID=C0W0D3_9ACTO|nr:rhodanese-like domain-containing protein [Gleimia coleocanis]EEH63992.1 rhodanese-like protein [Gleimia coleocanis DSM 15436]
MKTPLRPLSVIVAAAFALSACGGTTQPAASTGNEMNSNSKAKQSVVVGDATIIDVRTPEEYAEGHVDQAVNIDVKSADFAQQVSELDPNVQYYVYCRSGNRSAVAAQYMLENGFTNVTDLGSVTDAAEALSLPIVP